MAAGRARLAGLLSPLQEMGFECEAVRGALSAAFKEGGTDPAVLQRAAELLTGNS